jgi:hypothetical protein
VTKPFPLITRRPESLDQEAGAGERRDVLDRLRLIAMLTDTARVLELRSDRIGNPDVATALRTCAGDRRQAAERIRTDLASHGVLVAPPRPSVRVARHRPA